MTWAARARQLGWPPHQVRVVDGDLGVSGSVTGQRDAFEGMVAEVSLGREPPGRWWGPGARALGLAAGQVVERKPHEAVYSQADPRTAARLGRPRGDYAKFADHLARLTAAEPHATAERLIELEREAARATRQPAAYTDVTVRFPSRSRCCMPRSGKTLESWWSPQESRPGCGSSSQAIP